MTETEFKTESAWLAEAACRLKTLEATRPNLFESITQAIRMRSTGADKHRRSDHQRDLEQWNAANPEAVVLREEFDRREAPVEVERERLRELRRAELVQEEKLKCLNVVPRVQARVKEGLERTEALDIVDSFDASKSLWCCLILGSVGCGKSTAAGFHAVRCASGEIGRRNQLDVMWLRVVEASRLSGFGEVAEERFSIMRRTKLLVLDDLGTEMMTPTWQQALDDALDYRYQHSLRTLITSNLDAKGFKDRYGERLADRIREDGMVRSISAKSMRKTEATS